MLRLWYCALHCIVENCSLLCESSTHILLPVQIKHGGAHAMTWTGWIFDFFLRDQYISKKKINGEDVTQVDRAVDVVVYWTGRGVYGTGSGTSVYQASGTHWRGARSKY